MYGLGLCAHGVVFVAFYIVLRPQGIMEQMKTLRKRHRVHIAQGCFLVMRSFYVRLHTCAEYVSMNEFTCSEHSVRIRFRNCFQIALVRVTFSDMNGKKKSQARDILYLAKIQL